jgi:hypothetical protein
LKKYEKGMQMSRMIGKRIRQLCQILEDAGPCTSRDLCDRMMVDISNAGKYGNRAAGLGMVSVERGNNNVFTVTPGWREIADRSRTTKSRPESKAPQPKAQKVSRWHGISSVFQMGGL